MDNANLYFGTVGQTMLNVYYVLDYNLLSLFKSHGLFIIKGSLRKPKCWEYEKKVKTGLQIIGLGIYMKEEEQLNEYLMKQSSS
jgi:hypothetical protein